MSKRRNRMWWKESPTSAPKSTTTKTDKGKTKKEQRLQKKHRDNQQSPKSDPESKNDAQHEQKDPPDNQSSSTNIASDTPRSLTEILTTTNPTIDQLNFLIKAFEKPTPQTGSTEENKETKENDPSELKIEQNPYITYKNIDPDKAADLWKRDQALGYTAEELLTEWREEDDSKVRAKQFEKLDGGHSLSRHGPRTPISLHERRVRQGIAPDEDRTSTYASTQFLNNRDWMTARNNAFTLTHEHYNLPKNYFNNNQQPSYYAYQQYDIVVEYDRHIGNGVMGIGQPQRRKSEAPRYEERWGYDDTKNVSGLTRVFSRISWDWNKRRWVLSQHFPYAANWDDDRQRYTQNPHRKLYVDAPKNK